MRISGAGTGLRPVNGQTAQGVDGASSKLRSLEQKLRRLNSEKQKAAQNQDEEAQAKLEKQLQEVKRQIEQVKSSEAMRQKEAARASQKQQNVTPWEMGLGRYVDETA